MSARKTTRRGAAEPPPRQNGRMVVISGWAARALRLLTSPAGKVLLGLALIAAVAGAAVFGHYYFKFQTVIDLRLASGAFNRTARILSAPRPVYSGDALTPLDVSNGLRAAGYTQSQSNPVGWYRMSATAVEIHPGELSYFAREPAAIDFAEGKVVGIRALNGNRELEAYALEPELITNLFDNERTKRRLFQFDDYPRHLVEAVIAIEDHRFYSHRGLDAIRTARAAIDGILEWRKPRGTSTLTQQLARNFFLTRESTYSRKLAEAMIAFQLEMRLSKEKIFEYYSNQIFMGRSGSFNVNGLGEAARVYFDKDVRDVSLAEAALLAGLPQGPSYLNPYRHPERAKRRRNQVLAAMLREDYIDRAAHDVAAQEEVKVLRGHLEVRDAPYYVDLVNKNLREHFPSRELITKDYWVYTTLDRRLQNVAVEAVRAGMEDVDKIVAGQRRFRGVEEPPRAQAALVALDPKTGEVKAMVGGRDYGRSQLNRVLAKRQPGSVFKPFVFAAAIDSALDEERARLIEQGYEGQMPAYALGSYAPPPEPLTTGTLVDDVPTTFWFDKKPYEPSNHMNKIHGLITLRYALMRSINIATVKVGEMAGFQRVADMAARAGMGENLEATPALTLGAYEATPLEIAGAYTSFVNGGIRKEPHFVKLVRNSGGGRLLRAQHEDREVMDPRVAYIVTNMLEDVIRRGTGVRARFAYDLTVPAAGKTGTDDDGWFAGFTNNLLCVVWVGFDDNTDLSVEGAHSALPIWARFMKQAHELPEYADPEPFAVPEGVVSMDMDPEAQALATHPCSGCVKEVYIAGSQPTAFQMAENAGGVSTSVAGWTLPVEDENPEDGAEADEEKRKRKSGFFGRVIGIFQGGQKQTSQPQRR